MKIIKKELVYIVLIFILALFLRTWKLNQLPAGISHVEMDYIINAKSIWLSGKDLSQTWNPFKFEALDSREILAEWAALFLAPIVGPTENTVFIARFFNSLMQSISAVVIYFIVRKLIGKKTSLISGFLYAINPWSFHFGRTAYEASTGLTFFLLFYLVLIYAKKWKILWSFPFILCAFFSYHGYKFVFLAFSFFAILTSFIYWDRKKNLKPYLALLLLCTFLNFGYLFNYRQQAANKRSNEIFILNDERTSKEVNKERLESIDVRFKNLMSNKYLFWVRDFSSRYLSAFSAPYFFVYGDGAGVGGHTLWNHGYFYYIDLIFLAIGFAALFKNKRKVWLTLVFFVLVSPIPSAINSSGASYVHRGALMIPFCLIFISYGIYYVLNQFNKLKLVKFAVLGLYVFSFLNLAFIYFVRYPIYGSEGFHLSKRVMSEYIIKTKLKYPDKKIYVVDDESFACFENFLYFSDKLNKDTVGAVGGIIKNRKYEIDGIAFDSQCINISKLEEENAVVVVQNELSDIYCKNNEIYMDNPNLIEKDFKPLSITNLVDTSQIYQIYNDSLCSEFDLNTYNRVRDYSVFELDKLNDKDFCEFWIHRFWSKESEI